MPTYVSILRMYYKIDTKPRIKFVGYIIRYIKVNESVIGLNLIFVIVIR